MNKLSFAWLFAVVNVTVFLLSFAAGRQTQSLELLALHPGALFIDGGRASFTLLTHLFLHVNGLHLAGNLFLLWAFGEDLEEEIGAWKFATIYLGSGMLGGLCHALLYRAGAWAAIPLIGASGPVSAVLGAYFARHLRERIEVELLWWRVPLPVLMIGLLWAGVQVLLGLNLAQPSSGAMVATIVHGVGFLTGFLAMLARRKRVALNQPKQA